MIGGFQSFSMLDYQDKLCAIVFTRGCNFRCPYCHNPELVNGCQLVTPYKNEEVLALLEKRKGKLDAVVITGGEPTLHPELPGFIKQIKAMGFFVKLDTNGTNPGMIYKLLEHGLIDYIAMDIKAPFDKYELLTGAKVDIEKIKTSVDLIRNANVDYEFRTTVVDFLLDSDDVKKIITSLQGVKRYIIQNFNPSQTLDDTIMKPFDATSVNLLREFGAQRFEEFMIR